MDTAFTKLKVGGGIFSVYMIYCLIIIETEILYYIAELIQIKVPLGILEFCSAAMLGIIIFFSRSHLNFVRPKITVSMIFVCLIILILGFMKSVYPDGAFDTRNYHLISQSPEFTNFFSEHFAKGYTQAWAFRLGDRLFYYFRYLLGYRLGTMLNTIVLVISYVQIYNILDLIEERCGYESGPITNIVCNKAIWAGLVVLIHDVFTMIGIYFIDILAIPIACEIIRIMLSEAEEEHDIKSVGYFALLCGIWIAFKITNIWYVIPCVLIFVVKNKKIFTIKTWIIACVLGVLPYMVYLLHNFICTGNPVFPYFNGLFHSKYCNSVSTTYEWIGGVNLFEKIFWIFYAAFKPEYRLAEIWGEYNFILMLGVIAEIVFIIYCFRKKNDNCIRNMMLPLIIIVFASTLLWSFISGYSRYFIFGRILYGILAYVLCLKIASSLKTSGYVITGICVIIICVQMTLTYKSILQGRNYTWRKWDYNTFLEELGKVGKDKSFLDKNDYNIDMFYLSNTGYSGIAHLIDENIYTYEATYCDRYDIEEKIRETLLSSHSKEFSGRKINIHGRNVNDIAEYITTLDELGLYIEDIEGIYQSDLGGCLLIVVEKADNRTNTVYISDEEIRIPLNNEKSNSVLQFICGRFYPWEGSTSYTMKVYLMNEDIKTEILCIPVDNYNVVSYSIHLDTDEEILNIAFEFYDPNGNLIDSSQKNKIFILNPRVIGAE